MELIAIIFGFFIALFMYIKSGSAVLGPIGCVTVFFVYWIIGGILAVVTILVAGFLAKWILIGLLVLFLLSVLFRKRK
ncbi:hypothetical protein EI976_12605 [Bacillus licheniformis]|uniref:hypothetical protein n=1 Tax=Bacillus licheniformis TaxID=1402 RepID=UPI000D11AE78|nr:hypothetical protein [Bacillus licheniformis]KAA0808422.1 hypothetical protein EI978_15325 [Bacillus licheniformis]KAA0821889.1 hypothetical protein EI976_12605 [Bacillus licheniformis]KAA0823943.1 hypothetical protein EI973_11945 [Bacillus licheniformis]PSS52603.1 hypothetical protein C6399_17805 [Bacillus licheniformis]